MMNIEQFIVQSEGKWRSMRSVHSIAFRQFEQIISTISINLLDDKDPKVKQLLKSNNKEKSSYKNPFEMYWEADSDWNVEKSKQTTKGSTILMQ